MARLYDLCEELENIIQEGKVFVNTETGEVFSGEALDALMMEKDKKVDNCLKAMRQFELDAGQIDVEIKRLLALKKQYANRAEWLKGYVQTCLNGDKFKSDHFQISYRTTKAVVLTDFRKVPEIYFKDQTEKDVLKSQIMEVLKNGGTVPGAELEERTAMIVK